MKGYTHLTHRQRIEMEAHLKAGKPNKEIYTLIKCSESTFYREKRRGTRKNLLTDLSYNYVYDADFAQLDYKTKAKEKGPQLKIGNDHAFVKYIEDNILTGERSFYAALSDIENNGLKFKGRVSERTLYNYVHRKDVFLHIDRSSLMVKEKKRNYTKVKPRTKKPLQKSIEDRPKDILKRAVAGHWEMDTVIGKNEKGSVLLVLTERKTRYEIVRKIEGKTQAAVVAELDKIETELKQIGRRFSDVFKTITIDNGSEFFDDVGTERSVSGGKRTVAYFCHPSCPSERGSNENINKMVRRRIPKGESIDQFSVEYIADTQKYINNYPRRIHGGKSAQDLFYAEMGFTF